MSQDGHCCLRDGGGKRTPVQPERTESRRGEKREERRENFYLHLIARIDVFTVESRSRTFSP